MTESSFSQFPLNPELIKNLEVLKFSQPTPIQAKAIPQVFAGKDILATAQTGTGKTAAFALPIIQQLLDDESKSALILAPTRELAAQIEQTVYDLSQRECQKFKLALIVGGASMQKQKQALKKKPRLIVATPGRLNDFIRQKAIRLYQCSLVVLDEADQMLDLGFKPQIEAIAKHLPEERQTLFFTATLNKKTENLANTFLKEPVRICIGAADKPLDRIKQNVIVTSGKEKRSVLLTTIGERTGSILVFTRTKKTTDGLDKFLHEYGVKVAKIHGDCRQGHRNRALKGFRDGRYQVLVATNVAARGLDIPHIEHVVNFDLPEDREDYIHRIGRTARGGAEGESIAIITEEEKGQWDYLSGNGKAGKSKPRNARGGGGRDRARGRGRGRPQRSEDGDSYRDRRNAKRSSEGRSSSGFSSSAGGTDENRRFRRKGIRLVESSSRGDNDTQSQNRAAPAARGASKWSKSKKKFNAKAKPSFRGEGNQSKAKTVSPARARRRARRAAAQGKTLIS